MSEFGVAWLGIGKTPDRATSASARIRRPDHSRPCPRPCERSSDRIFNHSRAGAGKTEPQFSLILIVRSKDQHVTAPVFKVREVRLYEREVRLRLPFRFGVVTLTQAPQAFVRGRIELPDGSSHWGAAAELLAPKWFDKNLALSNEDNFEQLRLALVIAADAYTQAPAPRSAFAHFAAHYGEQIAEGGKRGLNPLLASFGPAQIDRAVLDALCRGASCSFYDAMRANLPGIDPALLPGALADLAGFDMPQFLAALTPAPAIAARHTVGLVDGITGHPRAADDGLPE